MKHTVYQLQEAKAGVAFRAAIAADLHGGADGEALEILRKIQPDFILVPGDLSDYFCVPKDQLSRERRLGYHHGIHFLRECVKIAPTFYSLGNHEMGGIHSGRPWAQKHFPSYRPLDKEIRLEIEATGVTLLDDAYVMHRGIAIGGLTSGLTYPDMIPNTEFLSEFAALDCYKVLLCHHPEYYPRYLQSLEIDVTVSGHAHGGQWSFFGQAIFAPGQGLFPKLVRGVHENRLVISRGMTNSAYLPRICVPCEVVELRVGAYGNL